MPKYINQEALLKDIEESVVFTAKSGQPSLEIRGANKITARIMAAPAADVVKVVRCRDCKSCEICFPFKEFGLESRPTYVCCLDFRKRMVLPNDYCSDGERKDEGE